MPAIPTLPRRLALATLALALGALLSPAAHAELTVQWVTQYGTSDIDDAYAITVDSLGQSWVAGGTYGSLGAANAGGRDLFLTRLSASGAVDFQRQHGGTGLDAGFGVAQVGGGTIFAAGYASSSTVDGVAWIGGNDGLAVRYNTSGSWQQTSRIGSTSDDTVYALAGNATNLLAGGIAGGSFDGNTHLGNTGEPDAFLSLRNSTGGLVWTRFISTTAFDLGLDVTLDAAGNSYLVGYTSGSLPGFSNAGSSDIFLARYDATGNQTLLKQIGSTGGPDEARGVAVDADGNIYLAGVTQGNLGGQINAGLQDAFVMKLNSAGTVLWTRLLGGSLNDEGDAIALDGAGHVWIGGSSRSTFGGHTNAGFQDACVAEYDTEGNLLGTTFLATASSENIESIAIGPDGTAYAAGWTVGQLGATSQGSTDVIVAKIVPEPSSVLLLTSGLVSLLIRRRARG